MPRKIDHCMIFFLIAGSYTPLCFVSLRGRVGWLLLAVCWSMSLLGIIISAVWIDAPKWLSAFCYLFAVWVAIFALRPLMDGLTCLGVSWLLAGSILYAFLKEYMDAVGPEEREKIQKMIDERKHPAF